MHRDAFTHANIPTSDRPTMIENRRLTVAMKLFRKIIDDFIGMDFTLEDIDDLYNDHYKDAPPGIRWGESHLDYLVNKGLLSFNEETNEYSINDDSPHVARIIMNIEGSEDEDED